MLKAIFLTGIIIYVFKSILKVELERQFIKQPLRVGDMTFGSHIFFTHLFNFMSKFNYIIYYIRDLA